ncbi:MAG: hydrogenase maturation protease [Candidatus Cloacimonetes bacterium]|nr:hydrogenase maturation protease [Candidatus Cloacimonadota bacterium]MCF7813439.1 hydrogenase maturation protease [Candidatus Cloacimonadota bacterium]MCF7867732.1 hydrogenase maturation protease [Candidatus Cloacimonadota bacterium]MCF7883182.1 hydrogenase maturation protease [Candidatus Cloacimonadota bacterium]
MQKTLVLGLGNTILSDDGVGIHIAFEIEKKCREIDVLEASAAGFRVVDEIIGYQKLILIDSIKTGKSVPGTLHRFTFDEFSRTMHHSSPHDISLFEAFDIMKKEKADLPEEIKVYAVEVCDTSTFSEECTIEVAKAIPEVAKIVIEENNLK